MKPIKFKSNMNINIFTYFNLKLFLLIVAFTTFATPCYSQSYISFGGGYGGEAESANLSIEVGRKNIERKTHQLFGLGAGFILNADGVPEETIESPIPHSSFTDLGIQQKGSEYALYGKYGENPFFLKETGIYLFGIFGGSFSEEVHLVQSNVTGWFWEQSSEVNVNFLYGGGLAFSPDESRFIIQTEYDNRRGFSASIGYTW